MTDTHQTTSVTTNATDLPETVFDTMDKPAVVSTLQGIKQEAHAVFSTGDQSTSGNALKLGTIAHVLLGVIGRLFPEAEPIIEVAEEVANPFEDKVDPVTGARKPFSFF